MAKQDVSLTVGYTLLHPPLPKAFLAQEDQRQAQLAQDPALTVDREKLRTVLEGALDEVCSHSPKGERNRAILERLWVDEAPYATIGKEFKLSPSRIAQIEATALKRLAPLRRQLIGYQESLPPLVKIAHNSLAAHRTAQYRAAHRPATSHVRFGTPKVTR